MRIQGLTPVELSELRAQEASDAHVPLTAAGGEPLRCCLRDARAGEGVLLTAYRPVLPLSPYQEQGAVFIHAHPAACEPVPADYPQFSLRRAQVLRAYDDRGWIGQCRTAAPGESAGVAAQLLEDPGARFVDVRNVGPGCYMFRVFPDDAVTPPG